MCHEYQSWAIGEAEKEYFFKIFEIGSEGEIDALKTVKSFYNDKFHYEYDEKTINFLKKHFYDDDSLYLMVRKGDEFVAFVSIDSNWWEEKSFFIREIFTQPKFQKCGFGEILMKKCIAYAKSCGATTVLTQTAFENIPMQKLCTKLGFKSWENLQWKEGITYKLKVS